MEYGHCCEGWKRHVLDCGSVCACVSVCVCVYVQLLITCCYQRLATRPRVCIFPADWPQSASPLPAPWLAAQTGAPVHKHNNNRKKDMGQKVRNTFSSQWALHTSIQQMWSQYEGGRLTVWQLASTALCFIAACWVNDDTKKGLKHTANKLIPDINVTSKVA